MYNNFKRNILNRSDTFNLYKTELNEYKDSYQNLMNKYNSKNDNDLVYHISASDKLNKLKKDQNKIQNDFSFEDNLIYLEYFDKYENYNELINQLKLDNLKLSSENKYLINLILDLFNQNKILSDFIGESLENDVINKPNIVEYYKNDRNFYKNYCESLIKKQKEYNLLFDSLLSHSLMELTKKQQNFDYVHKLNSCKNLNIAYVLRAFPTLSETFVRNELRWLKQHGFNVKVFSYFDPDKPAELDFDLEVIRFDVGGNLYENLKTLLIEHDIDLMHTHFVFPVATNFTFPVAEELKIPFTVFAHAYDIFIKENDGRNNVSEIANSKYCKGIFTLSNFHKKFLIERNVPNDKIIITRQATDYNISPIQKKNNKIKKIVSISRFVEKKGIDTLIDAANLLKDENFTFSIYGFGPLEAELKEQINRLGINNISVKGKLDSNEVPNVLKSSDLLVSPCRVAKNGDMDGFPTVIFESMAYGLPILTTNVSAIPEIITDNENGFIIEPNDPIGLCEKIKEIKSLSPEKLFEIRKNAQKDVQKLSSSENTMQTIINTWGDDFI